MHSQNDRVKLVVSNHRQEKHRRKPQTKGARFNTTKKCPHKSKTIIKKYRCNYPFGKKSKGKIYGPAIKKKVVCKNCKQILYIGK